MSVARRSRAALHAIVVAPPLSLLLTANWGFLRRLTTAPRRGASRPRPRRRLSSSRRTHVVRSSPRRWYGRIPAAHGRAERGRQEEADGVRADRDRRCRRRRLL